MRRNHAPLVFSFACLLTCLLASCLETEAATQVLVVVESDLTLGDELDTIEVRLLARDDLGNEDGPTQSFSLAADPEDGKHALPLSFSIAPKRRGSREDFRLVLTGLRAGEVTVEQQAIASFVPAKSLVLRLFLARSCLDRLCRDSRGRRTGRACASVSATCDEVEPNDALPMWEGRGTELEGASTPPENMDGGRSRPDAAEEDTGDDWRAEGGEPDARDEAGTPLTCGAGYEAVAGSCQDVDECAKEPGPCGEASCRNTAGSYACGDCAQGFAPRGGGTCLDIDECAAGSHNCAARAACANTEGSFTCTCPAGSSGMGAGENGCVDDDECRASPAPCDADPIATCNDTAGSFSCACPAGYSGDGVGALGCVPLLSTLSTSTGTLSPAFDPTITQYSADTGAWDPRVAITAGAPNGATLRIDGASASSGRPYDKSLNLGANAVPIVVSAGGASLTYTLTLTRTAPSRRYLKASNTGASDRFGEATALSADGTVLAVGASGEDASTSGVDTSPNEAAGEAGAVYVFRRTGNSWAQEAYLKPSSTAAGDLFGVALSLSADGSTLVVGAPRRASSTGAAYVFRRGASAWSEDAQIVAAAGGTGDSFGAAVSVSGDGTLIAVGAYAEASSTTGINSAPNEAAPFAGAAYLFRRSGGAWNQEAYVKAFNTGSNDYFGGWLTLSSDGSTLAVGAEGEATSGGDVDPTPNDLVSRAGAVYVYRLTSGSWAHEAFIKAAQTGVEDWFGSAAALSADGNTLVVGAYGEDSAAGGVNATANEAAGDAGAAYVYRRTGNTWAREAYLKAATPTADAYFGWSLSLSADGNQLAVGAYGARSAYLFRRAGSSWSQRASVPSPDADDSDAFGFSVALSASPLVLAVGAYGENSSSTGVDSTPNDSAISAGAAYVYQ